MNNFDTIFDKFINSNLSKLKFKDNNFELFLEKGGEKAEIEIKNSETPLEENHENTFEEICSPIVGVIYLSQGQGKENYVSLNSKVKKGQVLCILEAMKVFNELKAPFDGIIRKINFNSEDLVGQGDVIFEMEKC